MLNKYENSLDTSDCLGNTQQDKILEQEKDTVTPTEHEEIYENDVTPPTGNHIINTVADLLLQPNAVIMSTFNKVAIFTSISSGGWVVFEHHFEIVEGSFPNCSASHLPVFLCSTSTTFNRLIFFILIQLH